MSAKTTTITPPEPKQSIWTETPLASKIAIIALGITTLLAIPGLVLDFRAIGDGPSITVSSISGPYESPQPHNDPVWDGMTWFSRIKIGNNGNQPATKVAIPWEAGGYATVIGINGNSHSSPFSKRLELGELPRDATIEVSLWTEEEFSGNSSSNPKVSHSTGSEYIFRFDPPYWVSVLEDLFLIITMSIIGVASGLIVIKYKRLDALVSRANELKEELDLKRNELNEQREAANKGVHSDSNT